jgi:hypothetical protein
LKGLIGRFLQARGVDYGEPQIGKTRRALSQIACHPWLVIDQSQTFAD